MQALLYMPNREEPVAVLDSVTVIDYNDNHKQAPSRIFYRSRKLNSSKTMLELHRDEKLTLKLEDGRQANVLLRHASMDAQGHAVGVFSVLGSLAE
jgi:hypothetical protein